MLSTKATRFAVLLGAGLGIATEALAGVTLTSGYREVKAVGAAGAVKQSQNTNLLDWSSTALFYKSGSTGYWNGASQYATFEPDGPASFGNSFVAEGSTRSETFGPLPATEWSATSTFRVAFTVASPQTIDIVFTTRERNSGYVVAYLKAVGGSDIWTVGADTGDVDQHVEYDLSSGNYELQVVAHSTLSTSGAPGDTLYSMGVGFTAVPTPSAMALVAVSAFLRRRRT